MLGSAGRTLAECYDLAMLDLDGVVYIGDAAVPGASDHLQRVRSCGLHVAFITNNASRPPQAVADKLTLLGVPAQRDDVVTSAQAAAAVLAERFPEGTPIAVLGAAGLRSAVAEAGLVATGIADPTVAAVVSGYGPDVPWHEVMRTAVRVRAGLPWVASNTDLTLPTDDGPAPGHGVMVEMISRFSGVTPTVAGKPRRPLLDETIRRVGGDRPLMVGDRLDTDIEGGHAAGVDTLLVLTGVTGLEDLVAARPEQRPTYLAPDLAGLLESHPEAEQVSGAWGVAGWTASVVDGSLRVSGAGSPGDWWRAAAAAAWAHLDDAGAAVDTAGVVPPAPARAG